MPTVALPVRLAERVVAGCRIDAGGSLLAWQGLRPSTADVDSIRRLDDELRHAVSEVAERRGLAPDWLNDHASAFAPVTLDVADCDVLLDHPRLLVLGVPLRDVLLMKLSRSDPADLSDIRAIWPHVSDRFATAVAVVDAFHAAFPHEPDDEHLGAFVAAELAKGG